MHYNAIVNQVVDMSPLGKRNDWRPLKDVQNHVHNMLTLYRTRFRMGRRSW
jgi:hypothetical protein